MYLGKNNPEHQTFYFTDIIAKKDAKENVSKLILKCISNYKIGGWICKNYESDMPNGYSLRIS